MTTDAKQLLEIKVPEFAAQTQEFNEAQVEFDKIKKQVSGNMVESAVSYPLLMAVSVSDHLFRVAY